MKSKLSPAHEHPRVTAKRAEIVAAEARLQQAIRREKAARARLRERLPVVQSGDLKEGEILWSWSAHKHFDELGFDPAKTILFRDPGLRKLANGSVGDWLHINSVSLIGPNRHSMRAMLAFILTTSSGVRGRRSASFSSAGWSDQLCL
jgi:hypothetical protein